MFPMLIAIYSDEITEFKTDYNFEDYYNFEDLNRVEENVNFLDLQFEEIGYTSNIDSTIVNRSPSYINHFDSLNRIENNILKIKNATFEPLTWTTPVTDWVSVTKPFGFTDATRLEQNCSSLYEMLVKIKNSLWYLGTFYCGYSPGDLITEEGL